MICRPQIILGASLEDEEWLYLPRDGELSPRQRPQPAAGPSQAGGPQAGGSNH